MRDSLFGFHFIVLGLSVGLVSGMYASDAAALSFGEIRPVGESAATVSPTAVLGGLSGDKSPSVAVGADTAIALWMSKDFQVGPDLEDVDVVYARSTDGGETWVGPAYLDGDGSSTDSGEPFVTTDGNGVWVVAWNEQADRIVISRSADDGLTWSSPQVVSSELPGLYGNVHVASDGGNSWLVSWHFDPSGGDDADVYYARSLDDAVSWAPEVVLNPDAGAETLNDAVVQIAGDGSGNWNAVWDRNGTPVTSNSLDNAVTWSPVSVLGTGSFSGVSRPAIVTDGEGNWAAAWPSYLDFETGNIVAYSRSTDNGQTWTAAESLMGGAKNGSPTGSSAHMMMVAPGHFAVTWGTRDDFGSTTKSDLDIYYSESLDGGATWGPPALLNLNGNKDGPEVEDFGPAALAGDGSGNAVAVWMSNENLDGTVGDDWDILSSVSRLNCLQLPAEDCVSTSQSASSRLAVKDGRGGKDKLKWRWRKGMEVTGADLGDPTSTTDYTLCMYATAGGAEALVFSEDIPAGGLCDEVSCWAAEGDGFDYRDKRSDQGGVLRMSLLPGGDGTARIDVKGKGPVLAPPRLPLSVSTPIKVQLRNVESGGCWEAVFSTPRANNEKKLAAKSD